jgi:hypothetical protein
MPDTNLDANLDAAVKVAQAYADAPVTDPALLAQNPSAHFSQRGPLDVLNVGQRITSRTQMNELLRRVAPMVGATDPFKAAVMAMVGGTLVEFGADPVELAGPLFARLPGFLALAESVSGQVGKISPEKAFATNPDGVKAWHGLSLMMLPTMAVLTRSMAHRQAARASAELLRGIAAMREQNREASFVSQVLGFTDGMELVVLHPDEGKGFRVALEAVNTNFHLFTLLQGSLIGGGHLPGAARDPELTGVATGAVPHKRLLSDTAVWQFYAWAALVTDRTSAQDSMKTWIWGKGKPEDIPKFEGTRVVVLGPPVLGMPPWDSNFFANIHDALKSKAEVVEVLPAEKVMQWLDRIRNARPPGA